jgi:adenine-specific DNA-methyltransferase
MQHKLGQYFTTNHSLKDKIYEFILNNPDCILEPSIGQGDLVVYISNKLPNIIFDMYEIDNTIKLLDGVTNTNTVIYNDFIKSNISKKYKTIIGNPPYVKTKKGNLYIDFIEKCFNLLDNNGELIFIIPSDFFKLTSASNLLNEMMLNGSFTHIYHPHNEKLFENASIDVIIFRYVRGEICNRVLYNDQLLYIRNSDGLITFDTDASTKNENNILFKDYFDIYVGLVSGKDEVYKNNQLGNITVLNGENKYDKYIFSTSYPSENQEIDDYLLNHKTELLNRGIRKFNNNNWFEWGAPRNISIMKKYYNRDCIYVYNLTRKTSVAFVGKVTYFGGGLIMLLPKENINCNLNNIVSYINSDVYRKNFIFSGRFKIGHRQISNSFFNQNQSS